MPLLRVFGPALIEVLSVPVQDPPAVHEDRLAGVGAGQVDEPRAGDVRGSRADEGDANFLQRLAHNLERVQQACEDHGSGALLIIMPDRDLRLGLERIQDAETLRLGNVFQVHPAEGRLEHLHGADDLIWIFGIQGERDRVHPTQVFIEQGLPFHHRERRRRADIAQTQHARPVTDHRDRVPLVGEPINLLGILRDGAAGFRHSGRVPDGEIIETANRRFQRHLDLSSIEVVKVQRLLHRFLSLRE